MSLHERIRLMLRDREAPVLSEREAVAALRPHGQGVQGAPVNPPLKPTTPLDVESGGGLCEPAFDGPDST